MNEKLNTIRLLLFVIASLLVIQIFQNRESMPTPTVASEQNQVVEVVGKYRAIVPYPSRAGNYDRYLLRYSDGTVRIANPTYAFGDNVKFIMEVPSTGQYIPYVPAQ